MPCSVCCSALSLVPCCVLWLQITFEGEYPLDGAKVAEAALTRTVNRVVRQALAQPGCKASHGCTLQLAVHSTQELKAWVANNTARGLPPQQPAPPLQQQQQRLKQPGVGQRQHHLGDEL